MKTTTLASKPHENGTNEEDTFRTREQSAELGKAIRERVPRGSHAGWLPPPKRRDPVDMIMESSRGREPNLVPVRYGRMLQSPFAFFRGSASIMAADLSSTPRSGIQVQVCGDCHLMNFGGFASPERRVMFDINDFDETIPGPWEWDLKRLAASLVIASQHNGFDQEMARNAARKMVKEYRKRMEEYAGMDILKMWYSSISLEDIMNFSDHEEGKKRLNKRLEKASTRSLVDEDFPKLAELKDGKARIKDNPPLIFHYEDLDMKRDRAQAEEMLGLYLDTLSDDKKQMLRHYQLHDFAAKVVGVGSVGTRCSIALFMSANHDPLFLQVKEARSSVLEPFVGKSKYANKAQRVVNGQKLMQAASDIFLGWTQNKEGKHFYIRQLRDMKLKPMVEIFDEKLMQDYGALCGWALARAHARSGDAALISSYLGTSPKMDDAVADFALDYSVQNEKDYQALKKAVKKGTIEAYFES